ncbi:MAG: hypothetical protein WB997_17835, partial [Candidatus Acidiferrales bacterium]
MNANYEITRVQIPAAKRTSTRGVALIFTLLILALLMVLSLGMVIALSSQTFIGGYYRNFRGAFYSSDSGLNIARQAMVNQILSLVPATTTLGSQPLTAASATTVQTYVNTNYSAWTSIGGGQATNSWPGQFEISSSNPATFAQTNCQPSFSTVGTPPAGGPYTCANPPPASSTCSTAAGLLTNCYVINNFQYTYQYTLDVLGEVKGNEQSELAENGNISITVNITPPAGTTVNQSFAAWGTFIDQYAACSSMFVPGTLTGPFFTNGSWNFGDTGPYIFTDPVGSASSTASYIFSNEGGSPCVNAAATSDTDGGETIKPQFQAGFNLGQNKVPLPSNSYNQLEAVLDGKGCAGASGCTFDVPIPGTATAEHAVFNTILKDANGNAYPTGSSATPGVYLPYYMVGATPTLGTPLGAEGVGSLATTCAGGIYVEGDSTVTVAPLAGSTTAQVYTIVQSGTTYTVTINPTTNQTILTKGGTTKTITGVPENCSPGSVTADATMLYVNGNITSLSGPESSGGAASTGPAIQNGTALTITAADNVTITGDIRYVTEPVTFTQNQIPGTPADTLIPGNNYGQVFGIFTATGQIQMNNLQSNSNLEIDASIAMISAGGSGGWINTGAHINT